MGLKTNLIAATLGVALMGGAASAGVVYAEDFNRADNNTVGNGWSELGASNNDVRIRSNNLQLRDNLAGDADAAAATAVIDLTGLYNATLSFDWRAMNRNEANDVLNVAWSIAPSPSLSDPGLWTSLGQFGSANNSWSNELLSLGSAASNQMIRLLFWTDVSENNAGNREGFRIDNIEVSAVPVPAAGGFLLVSLAGLGLARRRQNKPNA